MRIPPDDDGDATRASHVLTGLLVAAALGVAVWLFIPRPSNVDAKRMAEAGAEVWALAMGIETSRVLCTEPASLVVSCDVSAPGGGGQPPKVYPLRCTASTSGAAMTCVLFTRAP